jgi:hypothetical protein
MDALDGEGKETVQGEPEIFALIIEDGEKKYTRRNFLGLTAAASAVMAMSGCTLGSLEINIKKSPTPTPTDTEIPPPTDTPTPVLTDTATLTPTEKPINPYTYRNFYIHTTTKSCGECCQYKLSNRTRGKLWKGQLSL